jgi:ATP adenylyltransferase
MLTSGELWSAVRRQSRRALETGALVPISTSVHVLAEQGLRFAVRRVEYIAKKEAAAPSKQNPDDPFAPPYEQDLYIGEISDTHVALLNKFNVLDDHLLLVTREYAPQTELLDESDFRAMLHAMAGTTGLAFYNGGTEAGASQPHKHLQVVPLPLAEDVPRIPFVPFFEQAAEGGGPARSPDLPFNHAVAAMPQGWRDDPDGAAGKVMHLYRQLWRELGYSHAGNEQPVPYNLLATDDWIWLVPRGREKHEGIAVNALGFAGALLVRDAAMQARLEEIGPLRVLAEVSVLSGA